MPRSLSGAGLSRATVVAACASGSTLTNSSVELAICRNRLRACDRHKGADMGTVTSVVALLLSVGGIAGAISALGPLLRVRRDLATDLDIWAKLPASTSKRMLLGTIDSRAALLVRRV